MYLFKMHIILGCILEYASHVRPIYLPSGHKTVQRERRILIVNYSPDVMSHTMNFLPLPRQTHDTAFQNQISFSVLLLSHFPLFSFRLKD